jgi:DNA repair protein RecN (Recombination protein N)
VLIELRLRGLGAIDEVTLCLGPGFTAVTGETGAGKTMVLTGLALLLGGRADAGLVRQGHLKAEVEGRFRVATTGPIADLVQDAGGELDGDELLIVRTVGADGRSRAYLGGRSVPVSMLSTLADDLVSVHGQADQRGLLRASVQRRVLDRYAAAAVDVPLAAYRTGFAELGQVQVELTEVTANRRQRAQEADALRHGLADIDAAAPVSGEDVALRGEARRLSHVEDLRRAAGLAHDSLSGAAAADPGGSDALSRIGAARHELSSTAWLPGWRRRRTCSRTSRPTLRRTPTVWTPTRSGWLPSRTDWPRWEGSPGGTPRTSTGCSRGRSRRASG